MVYINIERFTNRNCLKLKAIITEMAWGISPIYDFLFGSIRTSLPTDILHVILTVQTVKGIYMYRKDHTTESMIFASWSEKVMLFPSLRRRSRLTKTTRGVRQCCHGIMAILSNSLPLPWHKTIQERGVLEILEPGVWTNLGTTQWKQKGPYPRNDDDKLGHYRHRREDSTPS